MGEALQVQIWIVVLLAILAVGPVRLLIGRYRGTGSDTPASGTAATARAGLLLGAIVAAAASVLTPTAVRFARSPSFTPILLTVFSIAATIKVGNGLARGQMAPLIRGFRTPYVRATQPIRFWASVAWNVGLAGVMLLSAYRLIEDAPRRAVERRCDDPLQALSPQDEITACEQVVADHARRHLPLAYWISLRGIAHHRAGDYRLAIADYDTALRLRPADATTLYNRGLLRDTTQDAIADYSAAIAVDPNYGDAFSRRGLIYLNLGRFDAAIADFSREHGIHPRDPQPLANRAIAYTWKGDGEHARKDLATVQAIDRSGLVVLRTQAYLDMQAGDLNAALGLLDQALARSPDDPGSLSRRAEVYRRLGDTARSRADADRLDRLVKAKAPGTDIF